MTRERTIEAKCGRLAKARGCLFLKMDPRRHIGVVDRLVVLPNGRVWWVEFKRPGGGRLSPAQELRIAILRGLGQDVSVVDDAGGFVLKLDRRLARE